MSREKEVKTSEKTGDFVANRSRDLSSNTNRTVRKIESVNWHLWESCNYKCKFCFATFKGIKERLPKQDALLIPGLLANAGIRKINFVGGEPLLCPYISDLLSISKNLGMVVSVVTNATLLTKDFLEHNARYLNWVGISIDSSSEMTEKALGRGTGKHIEMAVSRAKMVKQFGIRLKINTVVTSLNYLDDMGPLISALQPDRWKVFQLLLIAGENDITAGNLLATSEQFKEFVTRHKQFKPIVEDNNAMTGSYLMVDPLGRFFQNWDNKYVRSDPITSVGVSHAIEQVGWDKHKYIKRGGSYEW